MFVILYIFQNARAASFKGMHETLRGAAELGRPSNAMGRGKRGAGACLWRMFKGLSRIVLKRRCHYRTPEQIADGGWRDSQDLPMTG